MQPNGKVHEEDCNWLNGCWANNLSTRNYQRMPATQAPKGKQHCSRC
jgi:hypothetical protein